MATLQIKDLKNIKDRIDKLSCDGKKEIFKIIRDNGHKYSENKNAILVDISKCSQAVLLQIKTFLDFSEDKKLTLLTDEESRDNFRSLVSN
jgi:hypothetical protein